MLLQGIGKHGFSRLGPGRSRSTLLHAHMSPHLNDRGGNTIDPKETQRQDSALQKLKQTRVMTAPQETEMESKVQNLLSNSGVETAGGFSCVCCVLDLT